MNRSSASIGKLGTSMALKQQERRELEESRQRKKWTSWTKRQLTTVFLLLFLIYFLLPFIWLLFAVTKTDTGLFSSFGLWFAPEFNLFANIQGVFTYSNGIFLTWLWNTIFYAVTSAVGAALIAALAGYAFAKFTFRGRNLLYAGIIASILVPNTALAIPTYFLVSKLGIVNTPLAVILPSLINPLGVFLMSIYTEQSLPQELLDAARIDGAGELRIFWSIAFRIFMPGFITVLLFSFVSTWNNYFLPLVVLNDPRYYPLTVGLASWNSQASAQGGGNLTFSLVTTGALISISLLIVAFVLLQRYWQSGLTIGSVKV